MADLQLRWEQLDGTADGDVRLDLGRRYARGVRQDGIAHLWYGWELQRDPHGHGRWRDRLEDTTDHGLGAATTATTAAAAAAAAAARTHLGFTKDPPPTLFLNGSFSVEVTAFDSQGGTATGFTGLVTVKLEGPIALGVLNGTKSVNAVNGIATFNNLSVTGLCTGCWLTATANGLSGATSGTFDVIALP